MAGISAPQLKAEITKIPSDLLNTFSPIRIYQSSSIINNVQTNIIIQEYFDQNLIIVSQIGKIGCLTKILIQNRPDHNQFFSLKSNGNSIRDELPPLDENDDFNRIEDKNDFASSSLIGNCSQQRLFGTHPPGKKSLYDLYNVHIALQLQKCLTTRRPETDSSFNEKPVIVGLALQQSSSAQRKGDEDNDDDDDDDFDLLANDERDRFQGILDSIKKACT